MAFPFSSWLRNGCDRPQRAASCCSVSPCALRSLRSAAPRLAAIAFPSTRRASLPAAAVSVIARCYRRAAVSMSYVVCPRSREECPKMSTQPNEETPRSGERKQERHLKSVGSKVTQAPQGVASIARKASSVAYRYTSATVRDIKEADLRFHTKPAELAQAITASAQATIGDFAGTAASHIGEATSTAATKTADIAQTTATGVGKATGIARSTATEIGNAMGVAAAGALEHGRLFRETCKESFEPLKTGARTVGDNTDEWAQDSRGGSLGSSSEPSGSGSNVQRPLASCLKRSSPWRACTAPGGQCDLASSFYEVEHSVPRQESRKGRGARLPRW